MATETLHPHDTDVFDRLLETCDYEGEIVHKIATWAQGALKAYVRAGCSREVLERHLDSLLPIAQEWLLDAARWMHETADQTKGDAVRLRLTEDALVSITRDERDSEAALRIAARLDEAMGEG